MAKNTKAKIKRTQKNHGIDLSSEISVPSIKDFTTREEFNAWKQKSENFLDRGNWKYSFVKNKNDVSISRKELNELKKKTKIAQKRAKKQLAQAEKLPFVAGGKQYGTVGDRIKQMPNANELGIYIPPDFNFDAIQNQSQLRMKRESIEKKVNPNEIDKRMEIMKDNFMKVLDASFNSDAEELIEKLKNVPADDFLEMYYMFEEFDFALYRSPKDADSGYHPDTVDQEHLADVSQMLAYVDAYERGDMNFDMKGFDR